MRKPFAMLIGMLALSPLGPAPAHAQSDQADATLTVDVLPQTVSVTNTAGIDFGQLYTSSGFVHSSDLGSGASWTVDTSGAGEVEIDFTLPTHLQNAGATSTIPLVYQSQSGSIEDGVNPPVLFDPAAGPVAYTIDPNQPSLTVKLGADLANNGSGDVSINPFGATAEVHSAVATLTVTII